nr:NnrS family protein [Ramlibacter albus]
MRHLLRAPHRLAFFLATVVLMASAAWWALVQFDRLAGLGLPYAVMPTLTHAAVMTLGFIPLFFAGFLFTAGPRWLNVDPPSAEEVLPALGAQAAGWLLWLAGAHTHWVVACGGLMGVAWGLASVTVRFVRLLATSPSHERLHAKAIATALVVGCACVAGLGVSVALSQPALGIAFVETALWGFVVAVYVTVAHRMIPFFTSNAVPMADTWRPNWVLALLLGTAAFEAATVWIELFVTSSGAWMGKRAIVEISAGSLLAWLAFRWGLVQSLKIRLLAMLHLGFVWLGIGLVLGGITRVAGVFAASPVLPLAWLHAVTMGCLGSLMLAMVTRVSCGHSGRSLVADNLVWTLFWVLQAAVLLRIAAAMSAAPVQALLLLAAVVWCGVMIAWGLRYASWWGRPRADGREG